MPTTTSAAPTSCPTLMIVARLSAAGHRQVELLEGTHALRSRDRARAAGAQAVGQEHGRRFAQPVKARLVTRVLERHDEDPRRAALGDTVLGLCAAAAGTPDAASHGTQSGRPDSVSRA